MSKITYVFLEKQDGMLLKNIWSRAMNHYVYLIPRLGGKFHPRYLPVVFTGLENTLKVANTGQLNFLLLK